MSNLLSLLQDARARRAPLLATLQAEHTDCYRLFDGDAEGRPGLTLDCYGSILLVQTQDAPLQEDEQAAIAELAAGEAWTLVYNDCRGERQDYANELDDNLLWEVQHERQISEGGIRYHFEARPQGQQVVLNLAQRAVRRRIHQAAAGKEVLSLFADTGSLGIAASHGGASFVQAIDHQDFRLRLARANAKLNSLPTRPRSLHSDLFAAMRQLSGTGQAKVVRRKKMPAFPELEARQFDLVLLDPPVYAKSPFGVVDSRNDYPALFKHALLATREGGQLLCVNHANEIDGNAWLEQLKRSAAKVGRTVHEAQWIPLDQDVPASPLLAVLLEV